MLNFARSVKFLALLAFASLLLACASLTARSQAQQGPLTPLPQQKERPRRSTPPSPQGQVQQPAPEQRRTAPPAKQEDSTLGDDEVVRVETNLTNILFTAVDREKRFITNLKKEDLRVLENGVPQEVSIFERETDLPLSLALLIDTSKSEERTLPDEKAAASAFLDATLRPDKDQAAIISFTGEPTIEQPLTSRKESLKSAIERVKIVLPPEPQEGEDEPDATQDPRGWTGIWDAVYATSNDLLSQTTEHTRRAIILLTDGQDTSSMTKKQEAIDRAVKANTVVYAIGIGDRKEYGMDEGALRKVAERTGGRAFFPRDEADLQAAFAQIQLELRSQYLIAYSPSNKSTDGSYRQINLEIINPELRKQKLRLLYRQGYYARQRQQSAAQAGVLSQDE